MAYIKLHNFVYDCARCHTRCDGKSKGVYIFENDVSFSEKYEQFIISRINQSVNYRASKTIQDGYPDIEVTTTNGHLHHFLEVKVQQRTFMSIQQKLPLSKLWPSETVALNLSDLTRYFKVEKDTGIATSIVWVLMNRLCLVKKDEVSFFYQSTKKLKEIYETEKMNRRFTRQSGEGDVVDGQHKGVTVNYHFSLNELKPWNG